MQFVHLQKSWHFPLELCPKLSTGKLRHCTSTVPSAVNLIRSRTIYHTEHPPLCTALSAWHSAQSRFVSNSWDMSRQVITLRILLIKPSSAFSKQSQNVRLSCKLPNLITGKNGALTLLITHHTEILPMEKGHVILKIIKGHAAFSIPELVSWLEFNVPFCHKYCWPIRDERSGVDSYPYPVKEG